MPVKIWSSLSLELLEKEILDASISKEKFLLLNLPEDIFQAEIVFGVFPENNSDSRASSKLKAKWIQVESVDYGKLEKFPNVVVSNMAGVFSQVIAESVLGCLLAFYRGLYSCWDAQQNCEWNRWPIRKAIDRLSNKHIVILGGGSIAKELIKLLIPFQCKIIVYRRKNSPLPHATIINSYESLVKPLKEVDVVINTLPASIETEHFLSRKRLNLFPPHAVLLNVGRGMTVDEDALIEMLKEQRLRAAILDVTKEEPIPSESPYWAIPNLYLIQHTAGGHSDELIWKCHFFAKNLKRYLANEPLLNRVTF